jgi:hypothetical protein
VVQLIIKNFKSAVKNNRNTKYDKCHLNVSLEVFICFFNLFLFKYKITLLVMQDSSHLTIILCSSVIKIVISQKQKFFFFKLLFMFSKKIIIKLFKIAPENFQTHT